MWIADKITKPLFIVTTITFPSIAFYVAIQDHTGASHREMVLAILTIAFLFSLFGVYKDKNSL